MKRFIVVGLIALNAVFAADDSSALKARIGKLEKEVADLKEENRKLRADAVAEESARARKVYTESVLPMLKPMLKDFGMDESILVPVEKIETLADAYRPLLIMIQKIGEVTSLK